MLNLECAGAIPPTSADGLAFVRRVEAASASRPQVKLTTEHLIHGGLYSRTICVPAGVMITGALVKIPTTLIVSGRALVVIGDRDAIEVDGYMVVPASANRKQVFVAISTTFITMTFQTASTTVSAAEREFTDEWSMLMSASCENSTTVTGE